ncbi:MAG: hypothetical protein COZ77_04945, partial [Gallionellales bacterium CG_4_8_14_3_um_filter_54_18]
RRTAALQRLSKLYAVLSQCNQAIVRCQNESELFPQICRAAVTFGSMKMAWIGMSDPASANGVRSCIDASSPLLSSA